MNNNDFQTIIKENKYEQLFNPNENKKKINYIGNVFCIEITFMKQNTMLITTVTQMLSEGRGKLLQCII